MTPTAANTAHEADAGPVPAAAGATTRFSSARVAAFTYRYMVVFVLVAMVVLFSLLLPETFPTVANLRTITGTQAVLIVLTLGLTATLAVGEFDLSFGAVLGFSSTLTAVLSVEHGWSTVPAVLAGVVAGTVVGSINGFFVVRLGISSLITTLGVSTILTGLTLAVSHQQVISGAPQLLVDLSADQLFGLPYPVYYGMALAAIAWYVYEHTPLGRYVYFTGEGREVARLSGLRVDAIRWGAFIVTGTVSGLAGVLTFGTLGSADPNIGGTYLLPAFAAAFLGATTIKPGRMNAWGTVVAVYVLVVGVTGLQLLGGAGWLEQVFNGSALVLAVTFARIVQRPNQS
ncbi:ABC transporter permease [Dactylosporangium maewongense]|uniref:ABC transporter permease n=2 Tax=Dactylosporangium maewongense TaxID=634393 RepID=A0ABN2D0R0_9ACTN